MTLNLIDAKDKWDFVVKEDSSKKITPIPITNGSILHQPLGAQISIFNF